MHGLGAGRLAMMESSISNQSFVIPMTRTASDQTLHVTMFIRTKQDTP